MGGGEVNSGTIGKMYREYSDHLALQASGIGKTFAGQVALRGFDISLRPGTIHCLVGENGSGKSTAIKVLSGYHQSDPGGHIAVGADGDTGKPSEEWTAEDARAIGLRVVHQDPGIFLDMSVLENIFLGAGFLNSRGIGHVHWNAERDRASAMLRRFEIEVDLDTEAARLSRAERAVLAIARALYDVERLERAILVLDEPTAALAIADVRRLHAALRRYRDRGVSVLYVTHSLSDVFALGDEVTILRDGRVQASNTVAESSTANLVQAMIGRSLDVSGKVDPTPTVTTSEEENNVPIVSVKDAVGNLARGISLEVRSGEIVGMAGLVGAGQSDLLKMIAGLTPILAGSIAVEGTQIESLDRQHLVNGIVSYVPADRRTEAMFSDHSVGDVLTLPATEQYFRRGHFAHARARRDIGDLIDRFGVVPPDPHRKMSQLSGGNQQKVVLAMRMRASPRVLLLDDPTQGVDVGAREDIYTILKQFTAEGATVIIASTDNEELARICDRVLIIESGRCIDEIARAELTEESISIRLVGAGAENHS